MQGSPLLGVADRRVVRDHRLRIHVHAATPHHAPPEVRPEETLAGAARVHELDVPATADVVGVRGLLLVVPHPLRTSLRVVVVDGRERCTGDIVQHVAAVRRQLHLAGILLGCFLVLRRPVILLVLDDRNGHPVADEVLLGRRQRLLVLVQVVLCDRGASGRHFRESRERQADDQGGHEGRDCFLHRYLLCCGLALHSCYESVAIELQCTYRGRERCVSLNDLILWVFL